MRISKSTSLLLAVLVCAAGLSAAPVDYDNPVYTYNAFKKRLGAWNSARDWSLKHVPTATEDVVIRDNTSVVVSQKVPSVSALLLGGTGESALTISKGGVLEIANQLRIGAAQNKTAGTLSLEGGHLRTGLKENGMPLHVGGTYSHSSQGFAFLRSGTFEGGIVVGGSLPNTGAGTLSIIGSGMHIEGKMPKDIFRLTPYGAVEFVLDEEGVSTSDYKDTELRLAKDSRVRVDGSAYKGKPQTIVLVAAKKVVNEGAIVACEGFDSRYAAKVVFDKRGMVLTIRAK